ncbi:MAG TPA: hypothetical protein PKL75_00995 [Treponemataceae bacterium]|nr:hypothetical protein [Treponemataceae bacterium]
MELYLREPLLKGRSRQVKERERCEDKRNYGFREENYGKFDEKMGRRGGKNMRKYPVNDNGANTGGNTREIPGFLAFDSSVSVSGEMIHERRRNEQKYQKMHN